MNIVLFLCILVVHWEPTLCRPSEQERVELWRKTNTWPPKWQPETDGMRALMEFREAEIMNLTAGNERWENWLQMTQSRLVPKFTSQGFDVIKTPKSVHQKLLSAVERGIINFDNLRSEGDVDVIYNSRMIITCMHTTSVNLS